MRRASGGRGRAGRGSLLRLISIIGVAAALGGACGDERRQTRTGANFGGSGSVTYYRDVLPILDQHCVGCHAAGGFAPFPLTSYDETQGYAGLIAAATQSGAMPPWPPAAGCGDFRDARTLSPAEVATLGAWSNTGAPAGDPADGRAFAPSPPITLGPPSVTLDPGVAYRPDSRLTDDYRCFLLDPRIAETSDLIGFDIHPGAPASVHHVLLYAVSAGDLGAVQALDAGDPGPGWPCFAGTGVDSTPTIGGWVPGSGAALFPAPTGIRLAAGTQVVMQIHYNLLADPDVSDRTTAGLTFSPTPVAKPAAVAAVLNDTFEIPAGAKSQTVTADLGVPLGVWLLWGVVPHMHLHGTAIKVEIQHVDGTSTCAIDIPNWSFHWQEFYYFTSPLTVVAGDTVHLSCTYDNSQSSTVLRWGEKTTDEMCLDYLYFSVP